MTQDERRCVERKSLRIDMNGYRIPVPSFVLEDREKRKMAALQSSITARVCGDPLPGYSALDRLGIEQ